MAADRGERRGIVARTVRNVGWALAAILLMWVALVVIGTIGIVGPVELVLVIVGVASLFLIGGRLTRRGRSTGREEPGGAR